MALLLFMLGSAKAAAQGEPSQAPDIQQMQKKVELLEKEVRDLRTQMSALTKPAPASAAAPSVAVGVQTPETKPPEKQEKSGTGSTVDYYVAKCVRGKQPMRSNAIHSNCLSTKLYDHGFESRMSANFCVGLPSVPLDLPTLAELRSRQCG